MEINEANVKQSKKGKFIAIGIGIIIIVLVVAGIITTNQIKQKQAEEERIKLEQEQLQKENEVKEKLAIGTRKMLENSTIGMKYVSLYVNGLNQFGNTLGESWVKGTIMGTDGSQQIVTTMKENDTTIVDTMNWLSSNMVDRYTEVYNVLLEMYDSYKAFYNKAINLYVTAGNSQEISNLGNEILEKYNRIVVMEPELKELMDNNTNDTSDNQS